MDNSTPVHDTSPAFDKDQNRRRLAAQVRENIVADFGSADLLRLFGVRVVTAIIDGHVLRLIAQRDAETPVTQEAINVTGE